MALKKDIEIQGLTFNYHRIAFVQSATNSHNSIVVLSYPSQEVREKEKTTLDIIRFATTYEKDYCEIFSIEEAYEYLKTLKEFKDAVDI